MNFAKETLAFDNKPNELAEENILKQKEQEIRIKNALHQRKTSNRQVDQHICRICLSEEESGNELISPCNCTGSMKFIHVECLKRMA